MKLFEQLRYDFTEFFKQVKLAVTFDKHEEIVRNGNSFLDALKKLEQDPAQKWTKELPTCAGVYWVCPKRDISYRFLVNVIDPYMNSKKTGRFRCYTFNGNIFDINDSYISDCLWFGPIIMPTPPTEEELNV